MTPLTQPPRTPSRGPRRTLWEEGRHPGRLVARSAFVVVLLAVLVDLSLSNDLGTFFDVVFVLVCVTAALWVHPRDFFTVGVLPPLLLASAVVVLAVVDRGAVASADDGVAQAFVSGLAHHAVALSVGYALTLVLLALRQVALRHQGTLRPRRRTAPAEVEAVLVADPEVAPLDTDLAAADDSLTGPVPHLPEGVRQV